MLRHRSSKTPEILSTLFQDRQRTNLLKNSERRMLAFLVQRIPPGVNSDMLSLFGFMGSLTTLAGFILAARVHRFFLFLGILGFAVNWFGDSLDGRLAYYRNKPRKWYGFSLDIIIDWLTTILIGFGYIFYVQGPWKALGFGFVAMYGWAMIIALLRFKVTGQYTIDSGPLGPTEVRVIISAVLATEVAFPGSIHSFAAVICVVLLWVNMIETYHLLRRADDCDRAAKKTKPAGSAFQELI